jgi:hypothetical protein
MSIEQIQKEVSRLPEPERRKFATWMLAHFPPRRGDELVSRAEAEARCGRWTPRPPEPDNIPSGEALELQHVEAVDEDMLAET